VDQHPLPKKLQQLLWLMFADTTQVAELVHVETFHIQQSQQ
jgi:hypothetical protein